MTDFLSQIPEPQIKEIYSLWKAQYHGNLPPFRSEFKIQSMPHHMWANLYFYNYTDDKRFYCVHNGTAIVQYFRVENTGHYLDDFITPETAKSIVPLYQEVIDRGQALYYRGDLQYSDNGFYVFSRILLPIRDKSGEVRHITGTMYATGEEKTFNRSPEAERRNVLWDAP